MIEPHIAKAVKDDNSGCLPVSEASLLLREIQDDQPQSMRVSWMQDGRRDVLFGATAQMKEDHIGAIARFAREDLAHLAT
jgi:hypothetical protein